MYHSELSLDNELYLCGLYNNHHNIGNPDVTSLPVASDIGGYWLLVFLRN
jgi:hypothetical protein